MGVPGCPNTLSKCEHQCPRNAGTVHDLRLSAPADRAGRPRTQANETTVETMSQLLKWRRPGDCGRSRIAVAVSAAQPDRGAKPQGELCDSLMQWNWPFPCGS
jgi:hypothetical protein